MTRPRAGGELVTTAEGHAYRYRECPASDAAARWQQAIELLAELATGERRDAEAPPPRVTRRQASRRIGRLLGRQRGGGAP